MDVKALITAAGIGKRLGALTRNTNKALLHIDGKSLLSHIVDKLRASHLNKIYVITGYKAKRLEHELGNRAHCVYNPFYTVSGILGSFWAARHYLKGHPFVFTTSDHFFHPQILTECLRSRGDVTIVVQKKKHYTKEDAKVIIRGSQVIRLGKDIPLSQADGEFGGMVYISGRLSRLFYQELENHFQKGNLYGYMMEILTVVSRKFCMPIRYTLCGEHSRIEVDSVHDLIQARHLAKKFNTRRNK